MRIFIVGFMGSGKTTLGRVLAEKLNLTFIDLDHFIEEKHKHSIASIFSLVGDEGFRKIEKVCLHEVFAKENIVVATGGGTPYYFDNMETMNENGTTVYLKVPPDVLVQRLLNSRMEYRPLLKGKTHEQLSEYVYKTLAERETIYAESTYVVDSDNINVNQLIKLFSQEEVAL